MMDAEVNMKNPKPALLSASRTSSSLLLLLSVLLLSVTSLEAVVDVDCLFGATKLCLPWEEEEAEEGSD